MGKKDKQINFRVSEKDKTRMERLSKDMGYKSIADYILDQTIYSGSQKEQKTRKRVYNIICLNPAIELVVKKGNLDRERNIDPNSQYFRVGAKAINIAILLSEFRMRSNVMFYSDGWTGSYMKSELESYGIDCDQLKSNFPTRVNISFKTETGNEEFAFGARKLHVAAKEKILNSINKMTVKDYLIITGSYHKDDDDFIIEMLELAKSKNIKVVIDINTKLLKKTLKYNSEFIYPRIKVLSEIYNQGEKIKSLKRAKEIMKKALDDGAKNIGLTVGENNLYIATENRKLYEAKVKLSGKIYQRATAESFVAGWLWKEDSEQSERIKWAIAVALAKSRMSELPKYRDVLKAYNSVKIVELKW